MNLVPKDPVSVLIVDDSPFMRLTMQKLLAKDPGIKVLDVARNGREGIEKLRLLHPQVVTMDIEMPDIDGLQALDEIMRWQPTPVIILSAITVEGAQATLKAFDLGAFDVVAKPDSAPGNDLHASIQELSEKIKAAAAVDPNQLPYRKRLASKTWTEVAKTSARYEGKARAHTSSMTIAQAQFELVAIGTSTGGPSALQVVLPQLPADFPVPVVVVQHMPVGFTAPLAQRLNGLCALEVREGVHGEVLNAGVVYVAPAGKQVEVRRRGEQLLLNIGDNASVPTLYRPSVDVLFLSMAKEVGRKGLGVVMTGMGNDGSRGMQMLKKAGGFSIVEAKETCVVYGMPKAIAELGLADRVVPLDEIALNIVECVRG